MKKQKRKAQRRALGDIVKIPLGKGFHNYGRVLDDATYAFYEGSFKEDLPIDRIVTLPVIFQVAVMDYAIRDGIWIIIGNKALQEELLTPRARFIQDPVRKDKFRIYENGQMRPAMREECEGLEAGAVWEASHVEDRLRDHYERRPNKWAESLKIRE